MPESKEEFQRGITNLADLQGVDGMLFAYPISTDLPFWGKNTEIDLRIAWFDAAGHKLDDGLIPAYSQEAASPGQPFKYALEMPADTVDFSGITHLRQSHIRAIYERPGEEAEEEIDICKYCGEPYERYHICPTAEPEPEESVAQNDDSEEDGEHT